jgi:colanic acid biosynthesis glycosyl transferase WcaI
MNVLIVSDAYPPEIRSSSHLMVELAEGLRDMGHTVHVLTSWPEYNLDEAAKSRSYEPSMMEDGVHVIRVKTLPHHKVNFLVRGAAQLTMPFLFQRALRRHLGEPIDAVLVYSPPLPLAAIGAWAKRRGARYILNVQDIFPQNAIDLGVLRNPLLIRLFEDMERQAYRQADIVTAHSAGNLQALARRHSNFAGKFRVLHNWIDAETGSAAPVFRGNWGLEGKFVALFAGVMGPSQALDVVLDVASRVRDLEDMTFLLVGDGMEKSRLTRRARTEELSNVVFRPFVSREHYPGLVASADVGLVTLSNRNRTPVVPGKILGYMAGGKVVAAFLNEESDGHLLLADAGCGYSCRSDQPDQIEALLRRLYAERSSAGAMGAAGSRYVREHFSRDVVLKQIDRWLSDDAASTTSHS